MFRKIDIHQESGLGLPYPVTVVGAEEELDATGARVGVRIPDTEGMCAAVALARCRWPPALSGQEVRFMRRALGASSGGMARRLTISPETYSRWENGKQALSPSLDKLFRLVVAVEMQHNGHPLVDIAALVDVVPAKACGAPVIVAQRLPVLPASGTPRLAWMATVKSNGKASDQL